ncbi:MAG: DUF3011 domain-containing protein [Bdellovibrionales bacterium]|nr:DUF3011 domain-containing protein [Bdellovibrionales bacterium]
MNKIKLMGIMVLAASSFGATLPQEAVASDISVCVSGVCVQRQRDGTGVDLRPDFRHPPGRNRPPRRPPPRRWPDPVRGYEFITCESIDQRTDECYFNPRWVRRVTLDRQHSRAPCIAGRTYGIQRDSVWVTNGCRATFVIDRY